MAEEHCPIRKTAQSEKSDKELIGRESTPYGSHQSKETSRRRSIEVRCACLPLSCKAGERQACEKTHHTVLYALKSCDTSAYFLMRASLSHHLVFAGRRGEL